MYETFKTPFHASTWDLQNQQDDGSIGKRSVGKEIGEKKQSSEYITVQLKRLIVKASVFFFFDIPVGVLSILPNASTSTQK